jgi:hypothetical protein
VLRQDAKGRALGCFTTSRACGKRWSEGGGAQQRSTPFIAAVAGERIGQGGSSATRGMRQEGDGGRSGRQWPGVAKAGDCRPKWGIAPGAGGGVRL